MAGIKRLIKLVSLTSLILLVLNGRALASTKYEAVPDTGVISTQQEAIAFVEKIKELETSSYWSHIKPALFLKNLKQNVHEPMSIYPGSATNFCGYGALTYLFLKEDPLGYAKLLLELYRNGSAKFRNVSFEPSEAVRKEAGRLRYKGVLDIRPAEQMWFMTLAGHFKGYINIFNRRYNRGDENTFWAGVNYAKFNHMVGSLLRYRTRAKGADLMRPRVGDLYEYISEKMRTGLIVLYINNRIVHKKNHTLKLAVPTHFIVAERISKEDDQITLVYWDYGGRTQMQMSSSFFKRIVFGITYCTKKGADEK